MSDIEPFSVRDVEWNGLYGLLVGEGHYGGDADCVVCGQRFSEREGHSSHGISIDVAGVGAKLIHDHCVDRLIVLLLTEAEKG